MTPRKLTIPAVLVVLAAACSPGTTPTTTTTTSTTITIPTTSTTAAESTSTVPPVTTTAPPTTMAPPPTDDPTAVGGLGAAGIGDEYFPELGNPGYDVSHYTLDLEFDPASGQLVGQATIEAVATDTLTSVNLDFARLDVERVGVDGSPAQFGEVREDLIVVPGAPIAAGEAFLVTVDYSGVPGAVTSTAIPLGVGWLDSGTGQHYVVAEPDAAHTWFPGNDHPLDKATFTFRLTVPDGVTAAANGALIDELDAGDRTTWVWEMDRPMATYLATVVIGDFTIVRDQAASADAGIPIRHVLPGSTTVADWPGLERQGEMVAFLSELFGPYPFDRYGIAIVDGFGAALENQTLSLFDTNLATSAFFEDVLIHEVAHQWYGDSVSPAAWRDIWLNEGFASYAEWLWLEREAGREELEAGIAAERALFASAGLPPPGDPPPWDLFNASVYRVGAMTLHALRLTVGDEAFFETLRRYAADFRDANASTEDFVGLAEEISGIELDDLFDAWLYDPEVPPFPAPG